MPTYAAIISVEYPIRIVNLRKVFRSNFLFQSKTDKVAVHNLCLSFQEGKLLALLGQNGAGKTTTMNILSGLTPASAGKISIYGKDVATEIENVRANLGVCPQHDILFNDLTAKEHIDLYGGIKGISDQEIARITKERFEWVQLTKVTNVRAGTFSGGMKRRLSVIISTIGDPKVVFMVSYCSSFKKATATKDICRMNRQQAWIPSIVDTFGPLLRISRRVVS